MDDVFALGLLITEVVTARSPVPSDDATEHYRAVFDSVRPTPAKLGVDVSGWEAVLQRALAVHPADRQANAHELARELVTALPANRRAPRSSSSGCFARARSLANDEPQCRGALRRFR